MKNNLFEILHAADDADCLIVGTALKLAKETATTLVGEVTDLLVLLLFHVQPEHCKVLLSTGTKSAADVKDVKVVQAATGAETYVRTPCLVMQWEATTLQVAFSLQEKACQCRS